MDHDKIWSLLGKRLSGEATALELTELEQLLRANPELHYSVQPLMDLWQSSNGQDKAAGHEAFRRHIQRMEELGVDFSSIDPDQLPGSAGNYGQPEESSGQPAGHSRKRTLRVALIAAPLLVLAFIVGRAFFPAKDIPAQKEATATEQQTRPLSEISTRNGSRTSLILPDGTKVWLNAGSKLSYDPAFGKTDRQVSLSGEGYFDVIKDKQKPFIIHASKINIKVLGTEFDVKSYPSDKTTETSLIRGSIEVTFNDQPSKKVILKPNEKLVVENFKFQNHLAQTTDNSRGQTAIPEVPKEIAVRNLTREDKTGDVIETSWVENKLVFQDESFEEIGRKLERWYGVSIRFDNERLKADHLTGSFTNETVRQALDALKFTASFNYSIDSTNNIKIY